MHKCLPSPNGRMTRVMITIFTQGVNFRGPSSQFSPKESTTICKFTHKKGSCSQCLHRGQLGGVMLQFSPKGSTSRGGSFAQGGEGNCAHLHSRSHSLSRHPSVHIYARTYILLGALMSLGDRRKSSCDMRDIIV